MADSAHLKSWIGRTEAARDVISLAPLRGLAALLDHDAPPWGDLAPPLAHWFYFLPTARQGKLAIDGHRERGDFLPPVPLPRRMWAGGRLQFLAPLRVGDVAERVSTIKDVAVKSGASGEMVFVTVTHEVRVGGAIVIREEQDIVYRGATGAQAPSAPDQKTATHTRAFRPDAVALFRFSALTFNAHRIHYDRDYATGVEGYRGLVVQGPFIATLLMEHFRAGARGATVGGFSFRARRPLFDGEEAVLCAGAGGDLWCRTAAGEVVMTARADT